ncbi:hypothetical protein RUMHYD_01691 [Blautia hydrogenotrophica DSM 10507]|uniref:Uncharacterized protein n=1 Tax=Blautia hydrogenotrophica (strain DSM 10507 / JCM 14656 / S5a33) TaxID=476272 RepID=C0CLG9_BLAHS|nr:hypothetical protein RUMHYD_01691 [Blautia hydrogenotrophica DSM 10507]
MCIKFAISQERESEILVFYYLRKYNKTKWKNIDLKYRVEKASV